MDVETRLAQRIADAITAGSYRPGEWLKQVDLATSFGVTRFEVRKALDELALRKAVTHTPEKGYRVSEPNATDVSQARQVRMILETSAARMMVERIDDEGLARLSDLAAEFWRAVQEGTPTDRSRINHLFHDVMYSYTGNSMLSQLIHEVRDRTRGTPMFYWPSVQSMHQSARGHDQIVAALRARDAETLVDAVRNHIAHNSPAPAS